jgi:7,8-dihydropterin-6-yl-methyl-4-(beta-D-ribofuranosyl)aminobenzene 5'-phosphate synthase
MSTQLRITVLVENTAGRRDVLAEHGLALWVETDKRKILFDTGQGLALAHNAQVLGIDLGSADDVVLSHGHYDHSGGLAHLYVHPAAVEPKFGARPGHAARYIGAALGSLAELEQTVARLTATRHPTKIADGVWVTGEIPRVTDFEDTGGTFYLDEAGTTLDPLLDDQAMYIETGEGLVVLLGCAHAGLVNTLDYVAAVTGRGRVHAVLGGMHLLHATPERVDRSIAALRHYDVQVVGPAHCTGLNAVARMLNAFPERFVKLAVGAVVSFDKSGP